MTFGEKLRQLRLQKGISQEMLAVKTGIARACLSNYERDVNKPPYEKLELIANVLDIPISDLQAYSRDLPPLPVKERRNKKLVEHCDKILTELPTPTNLGERIKQLRIMRYMTQTALANKAGITCTSLCSYEKGKKEPAYKTARAIADALNITLSELYGNITDENNKSDAPIMLRVENIHERKLKRLTTAFDKLSDKGQRELIKRAEELVCIPKYTTK